MPYGDGTGPNGLGPMSGRGLGVRRGFGIRNEHYGFGRGAGLGRGYGRGYGLRRFGYYQDEIPITQKEAIENELRIMKNRVAELENELKQFDK